MRPSFLAACACAAGIAIVVAGGAPARTTADRIKLRALMNPTEEVPAPSGDVADARGTFTATATRTGTGASLQWRLIFTNLTGDAVAAHIHTGARGVAGPVALALCGPCTSGVTGTAQIDSALLTAIQSDGAYVNVHTRTNPAGEIRAQVTSLATVRTVLNAGQEVPKPKGARFATGRFTVTAVKSGSSAVLTWRLTFSKLTGRAVAAHIHTGRRGVAGPVAVALCGPCLSGATGRATVNATVRAALEAGRTYVNVHTARNPAGEIRGQIPAVPLTITP
jgi:hypothetical protein